MKIRVLRPDPDLEAEGYAAGYEGDMPEPRARSLAARGYVAILPPETQARPRAPETKRV